jgi:nucleoside-diphosphate-sugar epimerase
MNYTVIGGNGFVGTEVVQQLIKRGETVWIPSKDDPDLYQKDLGIVIYCAGNGDCIKDPFKVLQSNTITLSLILQKSEFDKLIYISSTRVYMNQHQSNESCDLSIINEDERKLFNLTKLVSEELCIKSKRNCIIVRPSNVYGLALDSPLFLPSIIKHAILNAKVDMYVPKSYSKDYVAVSDVAEAIIFLTKSNNIIDKVFNIASGQNVTAKEIADILSEHTACEIIWHKNNSTEYFPETEIENIQKITECKPRSVKEDLKQMIDTYKKQLSSV